MQTFVVTRNNRCLLPFDFYNSFFSRETVLVVLFNAAPEAV